MHGSMAQALSPYQVRQPETPQDQQNQQDSLDSQQHKNMDSRSPHRMRNRSSKGASSSSGQGSSSGSPHYARKDGASSSSKMGIGYLLDPTGSGAGSSSAAARGSLPRSTSAWNLGESQRMSISSILNSSPGPSNHTASSSGRSPQSRYTCSYPQCGAVFSLFSEIKQHRAATHGLESHQCIYCKTVLAREANLMYHVNSKHRKAGENWCYKCSFKTPDFRAFKHHMDSVHSVRKCSYCGEKIMRGTQAKHRAQCHALNVQQNRVKRGKN